MSQHNDVLHTKRTYTRQDCTALSAWLQKIPPHTILERYFSLDDAETRFPRGGVDLERFLTAMRDELIAQQVDKNPYVAESLKHARMTGRFSKASINFLVQAPNEKLAKPVLEDPVSSWLKPIAAKRLKSDGINTLADLHQAIRSRGRGWYRPIPCLGPGKAKKIEAWLSAHQDSLGPLPSHVGNQEAEPRGICVLAPFSQEIVALERFVPAKALDGSQATNRHRQFPLISARNDYDAVNAYLYKFRDNEKTFKAYRKELERFLLWSISERGKAMSDLLVEDCEAYKDFLGEIPARWIGAKQRARRSPDWRPYAGQLSRESQKYAITVLRSFFSWLVDVRYLEGNPFVAVRTPTVASPLKRMKIQKALPDLLWSKLSEEGGILDQLCSMSDEELMVCYGVRNFGVTQLAPTLMLSQAHLLRAMLLLLGGTGMRREELAFATRNNLTPFERTVWQLAVLGKRRKWRYTYPTDREIKALRAHWEDRGENFDSACELPLVSPVMVPNSKAPTAKHLSNEPGSKGFSPDGIFRFISKWLTRLADDDRLDLSYEEREKLAHTGVHAFRHTFGTLAVANNVPLDVVQGMLGHTSLNTTTIYVSSEESRAANEVRRWRAAKN